MAKTHLQPIEKVPTGIKGVDEITGGGLPKGRPTLVAGAAGCGKTLFGVEFLVHGIQEYDEPGVLITFEESEPEISQNVASLGFDLKKLIKENKLRIDYISINSQEIEETPDYNLQGLFIRLGTAIDAIKAKRVVIDSLEVLFANFHNEAILRAELQQLFQWLKKKKVTTIVTGERGIDTLTRYGLEEYVADCVILLNNNMINEIATRRFRIIKYRGSTHGTNEYPFTITNKGFAVLPVTALGLNYPAPENFISSGIPDLDIMLNNKGIYQGSSIFITGASGTGKTTLASAIAQATSERGERCIFFAFEESVAQIIRNTKTIHLNLKKYIDSGLLQFITERPSAYGLETHLLLIQDAIEAFNPSVIILDPITNLIVIANALEVRAMLARLLYFLKQRKITAVFNHLTDPGNAEESKLGISSLMDTWFTLNNLEVGDIMVPTLRVYKSRGVPHSKQLKEIVLGSEGIHLRNLNIRKTV